MQELPYVRIFKLQSLFDRVLGSLLRYAIFSCSR